MTDDRVVMQAMLRRQQALFFDRLPLSVRQMCALAATMAPSYITSDGTVSEAQVCLMDVVDQGDGVEARRAAIEALTMQALYGDNGHVAQVDVWGKQEPNRQASPTTRDADPVRTLRDVRDALRKMEDNQRREHPADDGLNAARLGELAFTVDTVVTHIAKLGGPNPLDNRVMAVVESMSARGETDNAGFLGTAMAYAREAWRGSGDTGELANDVECMIGELESVAQTLRQYAPPNTV